MPSSRRARFVWPALVLIWLPGPLLAQFDSTRSRVTSVYPDISIEASAHLRTAASYVADQNWPEAIDLYQKLIDSFGNKVVQVGSSSVYVTVGDYCQLLLVNMPPKARAIYRQRVDAQAESQYRAAVRERDRTQLARVVERTFAGSWGDNALDALAELSFETGQFDEAFMFWKRIGTKPQPAGVADGKESAPQNPRLELVYPDTDLDPAMIEAKKILCQLFQGRKESAQSAIGEFRKRFPKVRGSIGGSDDLLADRLANLANEPGPPPGPDSSLWTTFAGNAQRTKVVAQAVEIGSLQWSAQLPQTSQPPIAIGNRVMSGTTDDTLSYHPLVLRDLVLVSGREEVRAYNLHEGSKDAVQPVWTFRLQDMMGQGSITATRPVFGSPHYTLSADRGRLYVRMGAPETTMPMRRGGRPDSYLVCLDIAADGKELWRIQPEPNEPDLAFEGSPAIADGNLYIGVTRGGAMTHSYLACYDAATGAKKWRTLICESSATSFFSNQGLISHNLPTIGAGLVFYNTNLGAVAALDQRTGRVRWIVTYARDSRDELAANVRSGTAKSEISPCIYHDGLVIAMPTDGQGIHAFDALTGELRWRTPEPPNFSHLLGVAHGKLICTGSQVVAIDAVTGGPAWQWPESSSLSGYGRGTLAGNNVYFPTKSHIYVLDQRTGRLVHQEPLQEKHEKSPGNLVIGEGYLVIAQAKNLSVFCQYEVLINRYRDLIAQSPNDPEPHFLLARAAESSKALDLAVEQYRETIKLSVPTGTEQARMNRLTAQNQLYALLIQLGQKSAAEQKWPQVEEHYREAIATAPSGQLKLDCTLQLAEVWRAARDGAKALTVLHEALSDDEMRGLGVTVEANRTVRADVEIAGRIEALLHQFGRDLYARFDTESQQILDQAEQSGSLATIERLLRTHPNAQATGQALLYLAEQYSKNMQYTAAHAAYKQLLARPNNPTSIKITAHHGIAELLETQRSWNAARVWWQRLAQEFPNDPFPPKPGQSVASFVSEHLSKSPYEPDRVALADRLQLPLARRWNRIWDETTRMIVPDGTPPADLGPLVLASTQQTLECLLVRTGDPVWRMRIPGPARWAGFYEDQVLVGMDSQLLCAAADSGEIRWQQKTASGLPGFAEFQLAEDRVYLREDSRRLHCLSAGSGATIWNYAPTEGTILPHTFFSSNHVALRTRQPGKFVGKFIILDGDGRRRLELNHPSDAWDHVPVTLDAQTVCIAADARTIQLLDLNDGKVVWSYVAINSDQKPLPIVGPNCLLVLVGGTTLVRLNPETGEPKWSTRLSLDVLPKGGKCWAVDGQMFYCITRDLNLRAIRLNDGELEWDQFLTGPGDQWQVTAAGGFVAACPRQARTNEGLPLVICRQRDGRPVQRLFFRPQGSETILHLATQETLIGSDRELWVLGKKE